MMAQHFARQALYSYVIAATLCFMCKTPFADDMTFNFTPGVCKA